MENQEVNAQEQEENQRQHLGAQVQMSGLYRVMCDTAAFKDLRRELEKKTQDLKNKWLSADAAEAEKIRIRGQVYEEVFNIIKSKILQGDMAARTLEKLNRPTSPFEQI